MSTEIRRLDEQLRQALEGKAWHGSSLLELLQFIGVTQHNLYHAGQIALLKGALAVGAQA